MRPLTWIIPYYRAAPMLRLHMQYLGDYAALIWRYLTLIYIDDGSPPEERPDEILKARARTMNVQLYRVLEDIPWNQHGARNLGAHVACTEWLLLSDMDRMFMGADMAQLLARPLDEACHYKAWGIDVGVTRLASGRPTKNQFLCRRAHYWRCGGYDEDYCGCYGGDKPFLDALAQIAPVKWMPDVRMLRYREAVQAGSTTTTLARDLGEYRRRYHDKVTLGRVAPCHPLRFEWTRVL